VLVIDAPHDAAPIVAAIGGRRVTGIVLTHGHNDHITAAPALREATGAPIWFSPADRMLWDAVHADAAPDHDLGEGTTFTVAGTTLTALATPGHSPGSICSRAARVRPAARTATGRRSWPRSASGCSPCPTTRS
jgi:glyoxylase-like metal-dependent hydrolase (beta-lactamase superfamily II)